MNADIVPITRNDLAGATGLGEKLLALNNSHARALSWLEAERLCHLVAQAFFAGRVGEADGLLIAFDQDADYDSPNFLWFRSRLARFVYVDRIAVAPEARGRGIARGLYHQLFNHAAQRGHDRIVCEINSSPPNPASDAFHAALGFTQMGSGTIFGGQKTVRYLERRLKQAVLF
jgi:predicted GNAT superfamily acetyltransferase